MTTYLPNAHGLGFPMEAQRLRKERLERRFWLVCKPIIWALILAGAFVSGLNVRQREPMTSGIEYRVKTQRLAVNTRRYELDPHENCLVMMHKDGKS